MQKIIDWFIKTAADLKEFDEHVQNEVQKYSNKQAKKAFIAGAIVGVAVGILL